MSAKVPQAVALANSALAEGKCVAIGLQCTGEAHTEGTVNKGRNDDEFVSGPRELLFKFVEEHYPVPENPSPKVLDDDDDEFSWCVTCNTKDERQLLFCSYCAMGVHRECNTPSSINFLTVSHNNDLVSRWVRSNCQQDPPDLEAHARYCSLYYDFLISQKRKANVIDLIRHLDLPNNPLDDIVDQLGGPDCVAEMTGRLNVAVRAPNGNGVRYVRRKRNIDERKKFMDDKKRVAIISEAASIGISLHADKRAVNQRRIVHITFELPWSADRAIQQLGRTHRSNQASAPQYRLLITNLGGERRFTSIIAKRLETLGALTQGDRRAGARQFLNAVNYDCRYGKMALAQMYKFVAGEEIPSVLPRGTSNAEFKDIVEDALRCVGIIKEHPWDHADHDVGLFFNRILGLHPPIQQRLAELFESFFDELIKRESFLSAKLPQLAVGDNSSTPAST